MAQSGEITLPKVVQGRLLEVADYQRPYSWERKQLDDIWEDLDLLGKGHHYAGTIVIKDMQQPELLAADGDALTRFEVVDGQQRLTTCLLLLDRIRRTLKKIDTGQAAEVAGRLRSMYGLLKIGGVDVPRLKLGPDLQPFWKNSVLGDQPIVEPTLVAGAQRLQAAAQYFDARIAMLTDGLPDEPAVGRLMELQRRIVSGLRFLVYEVQTDAEVGVVFETLNERGRPLTELEKVKNYLLYLARQLPEAQMTDLAATINGAWSHIFQMLSRRPPAFEERLLRAHWLCTVDPDTRQWKRITSIKAKFPRSKYVSGSERLGGSDGEARGDDSEASANLLYTEVKTYVESLRASATYLAELYDDAAEYHALSDVRNEIRSVTAALRRSPVIAIFYPMIFAFRLTHPSDGRAYVDLVRLCETYSARVFAICQRRSNAGEPYLARIAHSAFLKTLTPREALDRIAMLLLQYASDDEVRQSLMGTSNWFARAAHKYFLYEYERSFTKSDTDVIPWSEIIDAKNRRTTEHILPQNPDPESTWSAYFTRAEQDEMRHTLGNLVLTYDNSSYSNKDYQKKRGIPGQRSPRCYFTAPLRSEVDVANRYETWTPQTLRERQELIARWAMERWHVEPPEDEDLRATEDEIADEIEEMSSEEGQESM